MTEHIIRLSDSDLQALAAALRSGRLQNPVTAFVVQRLIHSSLAASIADDLNSLTSLGFNGTQIAHVLDVLVKDRRQHECIDELVDFVTTGPEAGAVSNRDTSVVVRELFAKANTSVLVAGYAVYQGQRVFQALADRMAEKSTLKVQLFLDIQRQHGDQTDAQSLVEKFRHRFLQHQWPPQRPVPQVYYFPKSLELSPESKACLHAKCVVVDNQEVFISSANFTEAAQERNIELGLLLRSNPIAMRVTRHFGTLLAEKLFCQLL
jgi:phosphatidylserine/phosphatidylglycerophosphate/cardiolipin synthase-like enzyme